MSYKSNVDITSQKKISFRIKFIHAQSHELYV